MFVGTSQVDITPAPGVELAGFAARVQPSVGVLDPLFARGLYVSRGDRRLLWLHADLIGLEREFVLAFRRQVCRRLGLSEGQVLLSATHTHSGPATVRIQEAGEYDAAYAAFLRERLDEAAQNAVVRAERCTAVVAVEGSCELAIDRRGTASAHTDPRVGAIGWLRPDGTFAAVVVNHAMHAVALGHGNRHISADVPGRTAAALSEGLPGRPIVLATNGACGNLNPPAKHVPVEQIAAWGRRIAGAVVDLLRNAPPVPDADLRVASRVVPLPVEVLSVEQIHAYADRIAGHAGSLAEWGDRFRRAAEGWRRKMIDAVARGEPGVRDAEIFAVSIGPVVLIGLNAEVFSEFTEIVREATGRQLYTVGYANGVIGYLPTAAAYAEGGYEVETAHLFYNDFRPKAGGLEMLAAEAARLVRDMSA